MPSETILIDSDIFIGLIFREDVHHETVKTSWRNLREQHVQFITTNLVITETATLLSRRIGLPIAKQFLELVDDIQTLIIDKRLHHQTVQLFHQQTRTKTSFVDLSNVVVVRKLGVSRIFSFDAVYAKDFGLPIMA